MDKTSVKTLQDLIAQSAACYGKKTFLVEKAGKENIKTSFSQLYENCRKLGSFLQIKSNGKRLHAAIIGLTSSAYLTAYFGTVSSGNIIIPLDAQLGEADLCDHLQRADAEILFFDARYAPMLPAVRKNCPAIHTYISLQEMPDILSITEVLAENKPMDWTPIPPASCAAILYTSGTTGKSKGVMLSHSNLIDNTMCQDNESTPEDVLLTVLPIHHVYCFTCDILLSLRYGTTVCVNDSMMRIAQNLKRFQPTLILLVPMIAETIYKKIQAAAEAKPEIPIRTIAQAVFGGKLRGIYSGGAYLNPKLIEGYRSLGIPIAQGYGMTECSPRISTGNLTDKSIGDIGTIVNGCEVKIVNGEIWAKSPSVMMGYYHNPEATEEVLTEDGWLKTGDLGYVDKKRHLFLTGRKKNLIILSNGENVSPEELENKFSGLDWLSEILIYAENGLITAEIFPNTEFLEAYGFEKVKQLFQEQVQEINKTVPSAKNIHCLRIRDSEFDKTTSKKIKRNQSHQGMILQ